MRFHSSLSYSTSRIQCICFYATVIVLCLYIETSPHKLNTFEKLLGELIIKNFVQVLGSSIFELTSRANCFLYLSTSLYLSFSVSLCLSLSLSLSLFLSLFLSLSASLSLSLSLSLSISLSASLSLSFSIRFSFCVFVSLYLWGRVNSEDTMTERKTDLDLTVNPNGNAFRVLSEGGQMKAKTLFNCFGYHLLTAYFNHIAMFYSVCSHTKMIKFNYGNYSS